MELLIGSVISIVSAMIGLAIGFAWHRQSTKEMRLVFAALENMSPRVELKRDEKGDPVGVTVLVSTKRLESTEQIYSPTITGGPPKRGETNPENIAETI